MRKESNGFRSSPARHRRAGLGHALLVGAQVAVVLATGSGAAPRERSSLPLEDRLTYAVSWLGIPVGEMTLESARVAGKPALVRILMTVRSSELFDSVYRVRGELESIYHLGRQSTRRFHERSSEQDESKDDLWEVNLKALKVRRTLDGEVSRLELPPTGALDPLALLYRIRVLAEKPGDEISLVAMTSQGALEARVSVERWERFDAPAGEVTGLKVVQRAVEDDEFGRGGTVTLWLASDPQRTPQRIEFDLPFGTLVATLVRPAERAVP